uniref:E3 ubiquitin-protein ligase MYCBP2 n=1 Tax=Plectus sambesii TaxID=2011161 RepID=A0A914WQL4_9BILA
MQCPLCKRKLEHPGLEELLRPLNDLFNEVANKAKLRLEYDGLLDSPALTSANSQFFGDPLAFAMDKYVYVLCHKCGKAYFGGESQCQQALDTSQYNPEELVCGACSDVAGAQICGRHGTEYLEYKCRFCCSVAVYFCFGTTHFCTICHDDFQRLMALPKQLLPKCPAGPKAVQLEGSCPLKVQHPETGEEFALGCGICRNLSTF